jgi:MOSC domain-containing protein YiiM
MTLVRVISINVGRPRLIRWQGQTYSTGIFKQPIAGRVMLRRTNLDGDRQADLSAHGGPDKAVYGYPSEHYPYWRNVLSTRDLAWGSFGENLTMEGMLETEVSVGDRFRLGSAIVMVKTPRIPCLKLAARFNRSTMIKEFLHSGYSGLYFSVVEEGEIGAGDQFQFLGGETPTLSIAEINRLYVSPPSDVELLKRATQVKSLPASWRDHFQAKLKDAREKAAI